MWNKVGVVFAGSRRKNLGGPRGRAAWTISDIIQKRILAGGAPNQEISPRFLFKTGTPPFKEKSLYHTHRDFAVVNSGLVCWEMDRIPKAEFLGVEKRKEKKKTRENTAKAGLLLLRRHRIKRGRFYSCPRTQNNLRALQA